MSVLVLLEQRGELKNCALEAATVAGSIAKAAGEELHAVYIGKGLGDQAGALKGFGISKLHVYENEKLAHYSCPSFAILPTRSGRKRSSALLRRWEKNFALPLPPGWALNWLRIASG